MSPSRQWCIVRPTVPLESRSAAHLPEGSEGSECRPPDMLSTGRSLPLRRPYRSTRSNTPRPARRSNVSDDQSSSKKFLAGAQYIGVLADDDAGGPQRREIVAYAPAPWAANS